jgi:hypothetical protein
VHYLLSLGLGPGAYAAKLRQCEDFALSIYLYTLEIRDGTSMYTAVNRAMHDPARTSADVALACTAFPTSSFCRRHSRRSQSHSSCTTAKFGVGSSTSSLGTLVGRTARARCMIQRCTFALARSLSGTSSCRR